VGGWVPFLEILEILGGVFEFPMQRNIQKRKKKYTENAMEYFSFVL
jgi:hypothetical protein